MRKKMSKKLILFFLMIACLFLAFPSFSFGGLNEKETSSLIGVEVRAVVEAQRTVILDKEYRINEMWSNTSNQDIPYLLKFKIEGENGELKNFDKIPPYIINQYQQLSKDINWEKTGKVYDRQELKQSHYHFLSIPIPFIELLRSCVYGELGVV